MTCTAHFGRIAHCNLRSATSEGGSLEKAVGPSTVQPSCVEVPKKRSLASTPRAPGAPSNCTRCQQPTGPQVDFCQNTAPVWNVVVGTCGTVRGGVAWKVKVSRARHCQVLALPQSQSRRRYFGREQHQTRRQLLIPSPLQTQEELLGDTGLCCRSETTSHRIHQRDRPTLVPTMLSICKKELEEVEWSRT